MQENHFTLLTMDRGFNVRMDLIESLFPVCIYLREFLF